MYFSRQDVAKSPYVPFLFLCDILVLVPHRLRPNKNKFISHKKCTRTYYIICLIDSATHRPNFFLNLGSAAGTKIGGTVMENIIEATWEKPGTKTNGSWNVNV